MDKNIFKTNANLILNVHDEVVAECSGEGRAEFIADCVNIHHELVLALDELERLATTLARKNRDESDKYPAIIAARELLKRACP